MNRICNGLAASTGFIITTTLGLGLLWLNSYGVALFFDADTLPVRFWTYVAWALVGIGGVGTCAVTMIRYVVFAPGEADNK